MAHWRHALNADTELQPVQDLANVHYPDDVLWAIALNTLAALYFKHDGWRADTEIQAPADWRTPYLRTSLRRLIDTALDHEAPETPTTAPRSPSAVTKEDRDRAAQIKAFFQCWQGPGGCQQKDNAGVEQPHPQCTDRGHARARNRSMPIDGAAPTTSTRRSSPSTTSGRRSPPSRGPRPSTTCSRSSTPPTAAASPPASPTASRPRRDRTGSRPRHSSVSSNDAARDADCRHREADRRKRHTYVKKWRSKQESERHRRTPYGNDSSD